MNSGLRLFVNCSLVLALGLLSACAEDPVDLQFQPVQASLDVAELAAVEGSGQTSYTGVIGGANQYEIVVPTEWNGELVLFAHGFVDSAEPIALPDKDNIEAIRDGVLDMGFAFASCSFRENGLAVKDGSRSVRQVHQIFRSKVKEEPTYTWLMGMSLGGLIAVDLAESHPAEFDGIVTAAGMIGGTKAEIDYMGDVRMLFDLLYPGTDLPGTVIEPAVVTNIDLEVIYPIVSAVTADPTGLGIISRLTPLPGETGEELVESLVTAIVFNFRALPDVLERTHGACPIDNFDSVYTERWPGALPPEVTAMVNATIERHDRSKATDRLFDRYFEPSGRLGVEMLAVHLAQDPIVPAFHEGLYAEKVASMGSSHLLEQRILTGYGHTLEIPAEETLRALVDLRSKVVPTAMAFPQP